MKIRIAASLLCACWWIAEYIHSSFGDRQRSKSQDQRSSMVWDVAHFLGIIGVATGFTPIGQVHFGSELMASCGIALMLAGISIRWSAIHTLGDNFSGQVRILEGQQLIQAGLYRYIRHPAYAGSLVAYLGMGLAYTNWFSLILIYLPVLLAALYRIRVEERVLREAFGDQYSDYSKSTKRLLPGIY